MNELIPVTKKDDNITVLGRDLHKFLEINSHYKDWIKRMAEYGFIEGEDYSILKNEQAILGASSRTDHQLTLDMAKEISMIQRNEKGKQARRYFIDCEKKLKQPLCIEDVIIQSAQKIKEVRLEQEAQAKQLQEITNRVDIVEAKQINSPHEFFSILGYCNLNKIKCELADAAKFGKHATKLSREWGVKMGNTPDPRFGQVNTYHIDVLNEVFRNDLEDL